jgi:hypothetical protein
MEENKDFDWKEMYENPTKSHSTKDIERAISECLSNLVGQELETSIKFIDYNPNKQGSSPGNPAEIHMVISQPLKDLFK